MKDNISNSPVYKKWCKLPTDGKPVEHIPDSSGSPLLAVSLAVLVLVLFVRLLIRRRPRGF